MNALYLAHAADIAYHRSPAAAAMERLGLETLSFRNKLTRTRGFLGVCDTHAVLAFRGTDPITLPNWVTDVVVRLVEREHYDGRVHLGFSSVLKRTWGEVAHVLEAVDGKPIFLTGHSMGGALAVLSACRMAKVDRPPAAVYTFGSPRIGDAAFCEGYSIPTYRIVNRLDIVPEMPLASVRKFLPKQARLIKGKLRDGIKKLIDRVPCYAHVKTFVHVDHDGEITIDSEVEPWHRHAVARAIATRGKSFHEGITDHLIANYIRSLEGQVRKPHTGNRRRIH